MKNKKFVPVILASLVLFSFCVITNDRANAQSKTVKKTVRKVIQPSIAPATPPAAVSTAEVVPTPPPPPPAESEIILPPKKQGLFGWGINADWGGSYLLNSRGQQGLLGLIGARGDIVFDDPFLLGGKVGLADDAVQYKLGLGLFLGNDTSNNPMSSIPLFADAVVYLKEGSFFGMDPFLGLGLNYNLYGTDQRFGGMGKQLYAGVLVDFGSDIGKTAIGIGYSAIKVDAIRLAEGIAVSISQPLLL